MTITDRSPAPSTAARPDPGRQRLPLVLIALLALAVTVSGELLRRQMLLQEKAGVQRTLQSIGRLKVQEIDNDLRQLAMDARQITEILAAREGRKWLTQGGRGRIPATLSAVLDSLVAAHSFRAMAVVDAAGTTRFGNGPAYANPAEREIVLSVMRDGRQPRFWMHRNDTPQASSAELDMVLPVPGADGAPSPGAVVLHTNAAGLFEHIRTWPLDSASGEAVLVGRDGNDAVYLSELRHWQGPPLGLRLPISDAPGATGYAAISAATGRHGGFESLDYRAQPVLAYTMPVPNTSWGLLVKVDADEALANFHRLGNIATPLAVLFALVFATAFWQWWRRMAQEAEASRRLLDSQAQLARSEQGLREAQRMAHIGNWEFDLATQTATWSDECYRIFEYDPATEPASYARFDARVHPKDRAGLENTLTGLMRSGDILSLNECRLLFPDGRIKWVQNRNTLRVDAQGRQRVIGTSQDITERRLAEDRLRQANAGLEDVRRQLEHSGQLFRQAQTLARVGSWERDLRTGKAYWSEECFRIFEFDPAEASPSREAYIQYIHPDDLEMLERNFAALYSGEQTELQMENRLRFPDGRIKWLQQHAVMQFDDRRQPVCLVGAVQDITDRKLAEEALRQANEDLATNNRRLQDAQVLLLQSEKLASIGQLSAGMAHEINNPISFVSSNIGALGRSLDELFALLDAYEAVGQEAETALRGSPVMAQLHAARHKTDPGFLKEDLRTLIEESREGVSRVSKIVLDLKNFARLDTGTEWEYADLHQGLDSTLNIARNELKTKATVQREYGELPRVQCLPSQLNQAFMNLLVNAAHAIEERGLIVVRTGREGDEVWIEIEDTGKGIPAENLGRIFDPFFTTKPVGQGTGMGLSISYGIVQRHSGRFEVSSEVGKGTKFRIWLPVEQPEQTDPPGAAVAAAAPS